MAQTWSISNEDADSDEAWKVVGSPPRRGSAVWSASTLEQTSTNDPMHYHPHHMTSQRQLQHQHPAKRGSFSSFQWEGGPGMFGSSGCDVDILSVPMVPSVPPEPIYRQHRSLSFSMGQDPTNFGYDDYEDDHCKSILATTLEDDDELDSQMRSLRLRSRSSGASSTGPLTPWSRFQFQQQQDSFRGYSCYPPVPDYEFTNPFQRSPSLPFVFPEQPQPDMSIMYHRRSPQLALSMPPPPPSLPPLMPIIKPTSTLPSPSSPSTSTYFPSSHLQKVPEEESIVSDVQPIHYQHPHEKTLSSSSALPSQLPTAGASTPTDTSITEATTPARTSSKKDQQLYMVEFKAGRTEFFYLDDAQIQPRVDDLVIVEADRGKDLGKVSICAPSREQVALLQSQKTQETVSGCNGGDGDGDGDGDGETSVAAGVDDLSPESAGSTLTGDLKRIYRLATPDEVNQLIVKGQDEKNALAVCQQKIKQRKLRMDVVDAEYQWDRRKLTFYFIAERRIDFRELVRELFKVYKTRIWMCAVNPTPNKSFSSSSSK